MTEGTNSTLTSNERTEVERLRDTVEQLRQEIGRLKAESRPSHETGDQRDAERYRFLVGECGASMLQSYFSVYDVKDWRGVKPALDKAIDSAMERDGSQKASE